MIDWQRRHGRHGLSWQQPQPGRGELRDPYRVWLSEVMLQQTQVAAVIPYYEAFLAEFPDVASLAAAPTERVMARWSGLGYYSRARNLQAAARTVVSCHGGAFPASAEALAELPGVGRSTAAAIAVFAFGERAAILDGNVKRVLGRLFAVPGLPGEAALTRRLWELAESELPPTGASAADLIAYTQGLMDLGATICTRTRPACDRCPLANACQARREGAMDRFPAPRPRRVLQSRAADLLLVVDGARVLVEQRPSKGLWGGLWSLPELAAEDVVGWPAEVCQARFEHAFTHFRMAATVWRVDGDPGAAGAAVVGAHGPQTGGAGREPGPRAGGAGHEPAAIAARVAADRPVRWLALADAATAPLPRPIKRLLTELGDTGAGPQRPLL